MPITSCSSQQLLATTEVSWVYKTSIESISLLRTLIQSEHSPYCATASLIEITDCVPRFICTTFCRRRWACGRSGKFMLIWSVGGDLLAVHVASACDHEHCMANSHRSRCHQLVQRVVVPYGCAAATRHSAHRRSPLTSLQSLVPLIANTMDIKIRNYQKWLSADVQQLRIEIRLEFLKSRPH